MLIPFLLLSLILSSCERSHQQFNLIQLEKTFQNTYYENGYEAGFINPETKKVDIALTYRAYLINNYFDKKFKINENKLKLLVLSRLLDMTEIINIDRGLSNEKETIDLAYELHINLDNELKTKILRTFEKKLIEESKKNPNSNRRAINNNEQYKAQIHYNFLYIADKFNIEISQTTAKLIINNLSSVEKNMSDIDRKSAKAIYYINMLKYHLDLPINSNGIYRELKYLKMPDGGYTFLPLEDQKAINLYKEGVKGDVFSTRLVNELLLHLDKKEVFSEETVNYLIQAIHKTSDLNDNYLYINNLYDTVYLSQIIGYNHYHELNVRR